MSTGPSTVPVPVTWEAYWGAARAVGTVAVQDTDLVLSVQTHVARVFTTRPQTLRVDLTDLDTVRHQRRLTCDVLELTVCDLEALRGVPGANGTTLRMDVQKRHRDLLRGLLDRLHLWM